MRVCENYKIWTTHGSAQRKYLKGREELQIFGAPLHCGKYVKPPFYALYYCLISMHNIAWLGGQKMRSKFLLMSKVRRKSSFAVRPDDLVSHFCIFIKSRFLCD